MPQGSTTTTLQIANGYVSSSVGLGDLPVELAAGNSAAGQAVLMSALRYVQTGAQQGGKLVGTGNSGNSQQGTSVALSADGNTMAVGGYFDASNIGAVWIFTRSGGTWSQQGGKLVGTGNTGASLQGIGVALSADGNTLAVGGSGDNATRGAVWIFTRSGGAWSQQGSKLTSGTTATVQAFGVSVCLSADGNTLGIGVSSDGSSVGAAFVFVRTGSTWAVQGSKLVGSGNTGTSQQGISISISADGNTLAVGGFTDATDVGATWIFTRSGTTWSQQGSKLVGTGGTSALQGRDVFLSANGNTLAVGGTGDNSNVGAVWIFTRSGTTWSQQGSKLTASSPAGATYFGRSVAISADGNVLIVGAAGGSVSRAFLWTRTNTTWSQQIGDINGTGLVGTNTGFGISVAISGSGNTFAVGANTENSQLGCACVFV